MNKYIQQKVVKHLKVEGFNFIVQPTFPSIVAWKPFTDAQGKFLALNVKAVLDGKEQNKILFPFFIAMIECNKLNKKEKVESKTLLKEGRCNTFLVAYEDNKKLKFEDIKLNSKKVKIKKFINFPSYIG